MNDRQCRRLQFLTADTVLTARQAAAHWPTSDEVALRRWRARGLTFTFEGAELVRWGDLVDDAQGRTLPATSMSTPDHDPVGAAWAALADA